MHEQLCPGRSRGLLCCTCSRKHQHLRDVHSRGRPIGFLGSQTLTPLSHHTALHPSRCILDPVRKKHPNGACRTHNQTCCRRRLRSENPTKLGHLFGHRRQCPRDPHGLLPVGPRVALIRRTDVKEDPQGWSHSL